MNDSSPAGRCPTCGAEVPPNAPGGLCPKCLFLDASRPTETGASRPSSRPPLPSLEAVAAAFPQLEIHELIGQGGMGCVFKARQPKLNRFVALKILPENLSVDPAFAARFAREAQALAALSHPNIVTIHDFGQAGGFFYLLMEFVDGVNLRQALRGGRFTPEQALAIVPPLCDALQFAHERGIVHRDIKPENLLLDKDGRVKITDFGVAKLVGPTAASYRSDSSYPSDGEPRPPAATTEAGRVMGTPPYMAPEQRTSPRTVDRRADIYSLGVVLYEMLTGEPPGDRLQPPSHKVQIDVRLDEVVLRALEKSPELRYQTAAEFRTVIETLTHAPSAPAPAETPPSPPVARPRLPWQIWIAVGWLALEGIGNLLAIPQKPQALGWATAKALFIVGLVRRWRPVYVLMLLAAALHVVYFARSAPVIALANWALLMLMGSAWRFYFGRDKAPRGRESVGGGPVPDARNGRQPLPWPRLASTVGFHFVLWVAVGGIALYFIPHMLEVLKDLQAPLPAYARASVGIVKFAQRFWVLLLPLLAALDFGVSVACQYLAGERARRVWSGLVIVTSGLLAAALPLSLIPSVIYAQEAGIDGATVPSVPPEALTTAPVVASARWLESSEKEGIHRWQIIRRTPCRLRVDVLDATERMEPGKVWFTSEARATVGTNDLLVRLSWRDRHLRVQLDGLALAQSDGSTEAWAEVPFEPPQPTLRVKRWGGPVIPLSGDHHSRICDIEMIRFVRGTQVLEKRLRFVIGVVQETDATPREVVAEWLRLIKDGQPTEGVWNLTTRGGNAGWSPSLTGLREFGRIRPMHQLGNDDQAMVVSGPFCDDWTWDRVQKEAEPQPGSGAAGGAGGEVGAQTNLSHAVVARCDRGEMQAALSHG